VRECNALAGERLWGVMSRKQSPFRVAVGQAVSPASRQWTTSDPPQQAGENACPTLTIESTTCPGDFVECTLDPVTGILSCRPGPALTAGCCEFQVERGAQGLRRGESVYNTAEALALILDELVFMHGDR
jgi:hypothetical protein